MRSFLILLALVAAAPAGAQQVASSTGRVYELHEVEVLPRPQNAAEFTAALAQAYPPHLRDAGMGGTVQVAFVIGTDGEPGEVRVVSTPDSSFSGPSVQAVSLLRFSPAQVAGQPVAVRVEQPITWRAEAPARVAAADAVVVPDSIHVYPVDEADTRPLPNDLRDFTAALRRLYPHPLRATGASATVVARFAVNPDGEPQYAHVLQSSDPRFDEATVQAVLRLRFQPARRGGEPVWVWMEVPVEWSDPGALAAADTADGYELSAVEELPRVINAGEFGRALARSYPPLLRDRGTDGIVIVRFRIEVDGTTSNASIVHTTHRAFAEPTLSALAVLRFRPAEVNGRPVRAWVEQPIHWSSQGGRPELDLATRRARMEQIEVTGMRWTWPGEAFRPTAGRWCTAADCRPWDETPLPA
ncbi:MAG TPA: energy transducer TonB, partial [Longimicrobium sp.]|nr:energy transducer TonB [Longimicrobium sp.]